MIRFVIILMLSLALVAQAAGDPFPLHESPQILPEIAFTDETGTPSTLDYWRGKFVLLNIWATWCTPCRAEMPIMDRLQSQLGGDNFELVALSIDRAGVGVVRKFFDEIGIGNLRIFIDPTMQTASDLKVFGLPATILVAPDGYELGRLVGPTEWDTPEMIAFLEAIIAKHRTRK